MTPPPTEAFMVVTAAREAYIHLLCVTPNELPQLNTNHPHLTCTIGSAIVPPARVQSNPVERSDTNNFEIS